MTESIRKIKKVFFVIIFLQGTCVAFSQDFLDSKKYEKLIEKGYKKSFIVQADSDTIRGLARFRFLTDLSTFWFIDEDGTKSYLYPDDIALLNYEGLPLYSFQGSLYVMIFDGEKIDLVQNASSFFQSASPDFLDMVLKDGFVLASQMYLSSVSDIGGGVGVYGAGVSIVATIIGQFITDHTPFFIRDNETNELIFFDAKVFRKKYDEIFKGCNQLVEEIEIKGFEYYDVQSVVKQYDNCLIEINE